MPGGRKSQMNVQNDKHPIISPADESDFENSGRYRGTGNVYPPLPPKETGPVDIVTLLRVPNEPQTRTTGKLGLSRGALTVFIAVINVVANVLMNVSLPVFAGTMDHVGGDTFVVLLVSSLWFPVIFAVMTLVMKYQTGISLSSFKPTANWKILLTVGFATTMNGVLIVFASPPSRTPPYLQGILATTVIPYTVVGRFFILRKGISLRRLVCTGIVLIGLFITVEPQIWGLEGSGDTGSGSTGNVLWPFIFALGFLPAGLSSVFVEKALHGTQSESLNFIMWTQVYQLITLLPLFWVDFIPHFGMAASIQEFGGILGTGLRCCFSSDPGCNGLWWKLWLFQIGYSFGNLFQFLLIEYAEGAVYAVVVQSMVTPLATLFWTLFKFDVQNNHFYWSPEFNITTAFTLGGLLIIVPTVIMYNYFSKQDAKEKELKEAHVRDIIDNHM
ncbi:crt homolog 3-like [Haliotis asinina]|uniref:crt homolog 3-like n=1 Tax=Haliotis asinina TaxID=109174 RepID=UPI0035320D09